MPRRPSGLAPGALGLLRFIGVSAAGRGHRANRHHQKQPFTAEHFHLVLIYVRCDGNKLARLNRFTYHYRLTDSNDGWIHLQLAQLSDRLDYGWPISWYLLINVIINLIT